MARKSVNWDEAIRKNLEYDVHYGQHKSVHHPHWAGEEGDKAALYRGAYVSPTAINYFNSASYWQQYRNYVTTARQGKGRTIGDRVQLTGENDFSNPGRNEMEYQKVAMTSAVENGGYGTSDIAIAVGIFGLAVVLLMYSR